MKAVNLVPRESRRNGAVPSLGSFGPAHLLIALLVVAVAFVTVYVLTNNTVSSRKTQLASLQQQISQMQAQVTRLDSYQKFEKLAQAREQTVRQIAATRFDWHGALSDLSKVVPSNTSLQTLTATVSSTSSIGGGSSSGGGGGNVRGDIDAPAFELKGCTGSQDEVAQLMSRLRLINGVTRVTLLDSQQSGQQSGVAVSSTTSEQGCPANGPAFDMVVFFTPMTGQIATTTTGAAQ